MKGLKKILLFIIMLFAFNVNVFAASGSLSVSSNNVYVGDTFTATVNMNSAAAWNIHVSATGPVSGCTINQVNATEDAKDTNKTFSANCTATGEGTITIRLNGDVASSSDDKVVNLSNSKIVIVSKKTTTPSSSIKTTTNNNNNNNNNKSKNNNIKELSVDGYKLVKLNDNNYTLTVNNDVTIINVKAIAEDSKAKVTGVGNHEINIGENNIEVIIIAENGSQNKINLKVTRKDGYYLEDLDSVLKNNAIEDINIVIKFDTKISLADLEKIKKSKKTVKFNYYDNDKNLVYSWIIDGTKLKNTNDLLTTIKNDSENKKDILRLSNYADGIFVSLQQLTSLPDEAIIKLFVGNKYEDNNLVNVYAYIKNDAKLELVNDKIKVENGYIEFNVVNASDYLLTMSTIANSIIPDKSQEKKLSILPIVCLGLLVSMLAIIVIYILKSKKQEKIITEKNIPIQTNNNYYNSIPNNNIQTPPLNNTNQDNNRNQFN